MNLQKNCCTILRLRKPKKIIIMALARKLAVMMLAVWKSGGTFCTVFPATQEAC